MINSLIKPKPMNIFFAVDNNYAKLLAVTLKSITKYISKKNTFHFYVLETNLNDEYKNILSSMIEGNNKIEFINVSKLLKKLAHKLTTRDYYTCSTYYRIFIPELFPKMDKCLYLDSDIVLFDNIAKLYNINLGFNLVGAARDEVLSFNPTFKEYADSTVGVGHMKYFNAGILLMNLKEMRKNHFYDRFIELLENRKFPVAQDQDYLNVLCKQRVRYIPLAWNKTPVLQPYFRNKFVKIAHFKMAFKPWHYKNILFEEQFWKMAKETPYYDDLISLRDNYSNEDIIKDEEASLSLFNLVVKENGDYKESIKEENERENYRTSKSFAIQ